MKRTRIVSSYCLQNYSDDDEECNLSFPVAQQPKSGLGLLLFEVSRSHSDTRHSVGLLSTSNQSAAEIST
jgi:hypothetical protein